MTDPIKSAPAPVAVPNQQQSANQKTATAQAKTETPKDKKSEWTHVNWFHNISEAVANKTHKWIGWAVAAVTMVFATPFTFSYDLITTALSDRKVSKPTEPVQNQVSAKGAPTAEGKKQPAEVKNQSTIEVLRKNNSELDDLIKAKEASASDQQEKADALEVVNQQLEAELASERQYRFDIGKKAEDDSKLWQERVGKMQKELDSRSWYNQELNRRNDLLNVKLSGLRQNKAKAIEDAKKDAVQKAEEAVNKKNQAEIAQLLNNHKEEIAGLEQKKQEQIAILLNRKKEEIRCLNEKHAADLEGFEDLVSDQRNELEALRLLVKTLKVDIKEIKSSENGYQLTLPRSEKGYKP